MKYDVVKIQVLNAPLILSDLLFRIVRIHIANDSASDQHTNIFWPFSTTYNSSKGTQYLSIIFNPHFENMKII